MTATIDALADEGGHARVIFCCFSEHSARLHAEALTRATAPCVRRTGRYTRRAFHGKGGAMNRWHPTRSLLCGVLPIVAGSSQAVSAEGSFDIPAGAHFSQAKLERIAEFFRNEVATGKIPGAILLIQQHGKPVYSESFGVRNVATKLPITPDTIFRLYSMTKPITSVAAMMLIDEGKLKLDEPLSKYIDPSPA